MVLIQPAAVTAALLVTALVLGISSTSVGASNYSDCGTNYTTLERALLDTEDNYYKIWITFYPPERSPPVYIDIRYNFKDQEGSGYTNDTISYISATAVVFFMQPPNVFSFTSLFFGHTSHSRHVGLNLTFPHECLVLFNITGSEDGAPTLLDVLTQRMKVYATYYRHERIAINDDYPLVSVRDHKGGRLERKFRSANGDILLFISVLLGIPFISLVSIFIITRGARLQMKRIWECKRVSFQASFSSTIAIGWVFSLFILFMDAVAIGEEMFNSHIHNNQAKNRYGSLPLLWITSVTLVIDFASIVIGVVCLAASAFFSENDKKTVRMQLISASFIAPLTCFSSHVGYCIIAWLSFPTTASALFIMYSLTFIFYFITLRQLYIALATRSAKGKKEYKEEGMKGVKVYALYAIIGVGSMLVACQIWLISGLVLLPISNIIESVPLYLQNAANTAFLSISGLLAFNLFMVKPKKKKQVNKIIKSALDTYEEIYNEQKTSGGLKMEPKGGGNSGASKESKMETKGGGNCGASEESGGQKTKIHNEFEKEKNLGKLIGVVLYSLEDLFSAENGNEPESTSIVSQAILY